MIQPKKWHEVYPYGTKEGDQEAQVFRALSRNPKYEYRSTSALIKETGLSRERIEEVLDKYMSYSPPLIYPHDKNEDHWGYWERCPDRVPADKRNISKKDQDARVAKKISGASLVSNWDDIEKDWELDV